MRCCIGGCSVVRSSSGGYSVVRSGYLEVAALAHHPHGDHLDDHLPQEVEVNHVIDHLNYSLFCFVKLQDVPSTAMFPRAGLHYMIRREGPRNIGWGRAEYS